MKHLSRLTPATVDVLKALSATEGHVWGLQVVKTTGRPSGSVYPILDRLENLGWVVSSWEDNSSRPGARRRYYRLRDEARELARDAVSALDDKRAIVPASRLSPGHAGA